MTRRTDRVSEQIRGELARLLQSEITDPRVGMVTLTRVDLSPDFRNARVDWSRFDPGDGDASDPEALERAEQAARETQAGLESAAGFLRSRLAKALPLKRVPELRFHHDTSLALGARTLELIAELDPRPDDAQGADEDPGAERS